MDKLSERVERAEGPSRELDAEIALAVGYADCRPWSAASNHRHPVENRYGHGFSPPVFTGSLDDARSLVPKGWHISLLAQGRYDQLTTVVVQRNGDNSGTCEGCENAATPALALCAAALKARGL